MKTTLERINELLAANPEKEYTRKMIADELGAPMLTVKDLMYRHSDQFIVNVDMSKKRKAETHTYMYKPESENINDTYLWSAPK